MFQAVRVKGFKNMAYVCETLQIIDGLQTCANWIEQTSLLDELKITKSQALMLLTPIGSVYVLLIAWSYISLIAKKYT